MLNKVTRLKTGFSGGGVARRQHPPVQKPKGIVKEGAVYHAQPSSDPERATELDMSQRINAMELNMLTILREMQLLSGRNVDPYAFNKVYLPNNVIPMKGRKSRAIPVSVPGNEAEELYLPSGAMVKDVIPHHIPHSGYVGVHPPETVRKLSEITSVRPDDAADIAWNNGMDLVELTEIAYREFTRRELHCYDYHDKARDEVKFIRQWSQQGMDVRVGKYGLHKYHVSKDTCFAAWYRESKVYDTHFKLIANEKLMEHVHTYHPPSPRVPGEVVARQRIAVRRKDALRSKLSYFNDRNRERFAEVGKVSTRLQHGVAVTTASQMAALGALRRDMGDSIRNALGMKPARRGFDKIRDEALIETCHKDPNEFQWFVLGRWATPDRWVKNWKTIRTCSGASQRWFDTGSTRAVNLDELTPRDRMNFIGNQLIKRGLNDPLHVSAMQAHLLSLYGNSLLKKPGA